MTADPAHLEHARKVADAVLYEGYVLYPYRRSAQKNRTRFQFGVLMPPPYRAVDEHEPSASQTECLVECPPDAEIDVGLRFLHLQRRTAQRIDLGTGEAGNVDTLSVGGTEYGSFDEAVEREQHLHVRVENRTTPQATLCSRDDGLRYSLIAAHLLIGVTGGTFLSMTDPPEWAAGEVAGCENAGTWPVLAGPADCRDLMLSSPVILYDHPEIAPESAGDLFDATEIDEILTLRTLALTDEERQEARATDQRAADLIDRLDGLPPEMLERMHGAIRYLSPGPGKAAGAPPTFAPPEFPSDFPAAGTPSQPWWDPGADTSVSPETDHVLVAGVRVARGSRVRMRPGARRADAQDIFLAGREALVEAVLHDVDGQVHVAVSPVSDPLADLQRNHGRFLYFAPDEIEPVPAAGGGGTVDDGEYRKEETR